MGDRGLLGSITSLDLLLVLLELLLCGLVRDAKHLMLGTKVVIQSLRIELGQLVDGAAGKHILSEVH